MPIKCFHAHDVLLRCEFDVLPTFLSILAYLGIVGPFRLGSLSLFEYFIRYDRLVVVFNQIRILSRFWQWRSRNISCFDRIISMVRLLKMFFPVGDRMPSASSAALIFKMLIPHRYIANIQSQEYRPWIGCSKSDIGDRDTVWFVRTR